VWEGLFYTGEIEVRGSDRWNLKSFRFCYDCGSIPIENVMEAIRSSRRELSPDLDLLILSHLHADHVNGLSELLGGLKVKEVIMPYFTPLERLIIGISNLRQPSWFYEFLAEPVPFLLKRGVERVTIIGGEKGNPEEIPPEGKEYENKMKLEDLPDDKSLKEKIEQGESENWREALRNKRLLVKSHERSLPCMGVWMFRFFNYRVPSPAIENFRERLKDNSGELMNIKEILQDRK